MSAATGAVVGTFLVGDGTLVGQPPSSAGIAGRPQLVLQGQSFTLLNYTALAQPGKAVLLLDGKQTDAIGVTVAATAKPVLTLTAKPYSLVIPIIAFPGKAQLLLNGKPTASVISGTAIVGKPQLILTAKVAGAGQVVFLPSQPVTVDLVPTTPQTIDLVATVPATLDLVPTNEEFR